MELALLYTFPFWVAGLLFVIVLLIALESGYRVGFARRETWKDADSGGGAIVQTSMFALLGLVLAFTYASGISHHDARKQAVPVEANALGTAFQRADILAEPGRTELKKVLLDYARTRSFPPGSLQSNEERKAAVIRTLKQQAKIWPATKHTLEQENPIPMEASLVVAINSVFDAHTFRLAAIFDTLPKIVMWMLLFVAAASLRGAAETQASLIGCVQCRPNAPGFAGITGAMQYAIAVRTAFGLNIRSDVLIEQEEIAIKS